MPEAPINLTPKTLTPREQLIALLAEEHGITKAHAATVLRRAFQHLRPVPAEAATDVPPAATISPDTLDPHAP